MTLQIDLGNYIPSIKNFIDDYNHLIQIVLQKRKGMLRNYFVCKNNLRNGKQFYGKLRVKLVVLLIRQKGLVGWLGLKDKIDNEEENHITCLAELCVAYFLCILLCCFLVWVA